MFKKIIIDNEENLFDQLKGSTNFENVINGRQGTVLVDCKDNLVPIVRTTTMYDIPAQQFLPIHQHIIKKINDNINIGINIGTNNELKFNNALIEIYNPTYKKMRFHSDQALDLENNSYIAVFSCYKNRQKH